MNKTYLSLAIAFLFFNLGATAADYRLLFQSGALTPDENLEQFISAPGADATELVNGYYYRLIQFKDIPSAEKKSAMRQSGIVLLDYMPRNAFVAAIPDGYNRSLLSGYGIRSIYRMEGYQKINRNLFDETPSWAKTVKGYADIRVLYYGNIGEADILALAASKGKVLQHVALNHVISLRIPENELRMIASLPWVYYMESIAPPSTADDTKGRSLHRSNVINTDMPMGRHYNGSGVSVALGDDGVVGPHIDFTGRMTNHTSTNTAFDTHGDMTGGIISGAGNLDPTIRGMADGSFLHVWYYSAYPQIVDAVANHATYGTVVSSTSYSQGCNDYTADAQFGDQTTRDNPYLLFVFSAGNNGTGLTHGDCGYGAGLPWATITGGYKQGKNVIACANLDALEVLDNSSSRGPASDGRIKPDISSNGKDQMSTDENNLYQVGGGTSAACPGIAGVSAQLIQAYKELNSAAYAPGALIKPCLLNSAEDIGNPGPDFTYGYGRVNALRAVKVIENNTFFHDSLVQGATNTHTINVPANAVRLKVMVYWPDVGGNPAASTALVNDIDMTVTDPSATTWNPWILNATPVASSLNAPATRGSDHLNNMEQVTLENPAAGSYTVSLNGFAIPSGPQEYYLVYEFIFDEITVTYPMGGEGFVPGTTEVIRWDAVRSAGTFTLEYSTDHGTTWNLISSGFAGTTQQYSWSVPPTVTDQALVRVSRGLVSGTSANDFSIVGLPANLNVVWCCTDSMKLSWSAVTGATGYQVHMLGTNYMDSVGTTTNTYFIVHNVSPSNTYWFSVRALLPGGKGQRTLAIKKSPGAFNCPLNLDATIAQLVSPAPGRIQDCQNLGAVPVTLNIENVGASTLTNIPVNYSLNGGPTVSDLYTGSLVPGQSQAFTFATPVNLTVQGNYNLAVWTDYPGDMSHLNDTSKSSMTVFAGTMATYPFIENFESFASCNTGSDCGLTNCTVLNGWVQEVNGTGDDIDFRTNQGSTPTGGTGPDVDHTLGNTTGKYMYLEASQCFLKNAVLTSPCISVSGLSPQCSFWYHMSGVDMGSLHVDLYSNGQWMSDITPPLSGNQPNAWLQRVFDLSAYNGQVINLRFRGTTGSNSGSDMAIDDISIDEPVGIDEINSSSGVSVYPNPSSGLFTVSVAKPGNYQVEIVDLNGKVVNTGVIQSTRNSMTTLDMSGYAKGIYTVILRGKETMRTRITIL